jgi:hypothetical protein
MISFNSVVAEAHSATREYLFSLLFVISYVKLNSYTHQSYTKILPEKKNQNRKTLQKAQKKVELFL